MTTDHLGSTRLATTADGTVLGYHDYLPFGEEIPATIGGRSGLYGSAGDAVTHKFTGQERDAETASSAMQGLDYFGARYYSGAMGRFMTPDWSAKPQPIPYADLTDPQTLNLYGYVRNNPLTEDDVDGHGGCEAAAGGNTQKWLTCKGVHPEITGYTIGPPPETRNTTEKVQDRVVGAAKGFAGALLSVFDLMGAPRANTDQIRNALRLDPASRNEQFGATVGVALAMLLRGGGGSLWHEGSFASAGESLAYHFAEHGEEVGAASAEQYLNKALEFSKSLRRAASAPVDGLTEGVTRYSKSGRYIDLAPDGRIISFGTTK